VRGTVERGEDGLLRSSVVEMPTGGAEGPWRGRHSGECGCQGGTGMHSAARGEFFLRLGASASG
jgi:hypothetical protein